MRGEGEEGLRTLRPLDITLLCECLREWDHLRHYVRHHASCRSVEARRVGLTLSLLPLVLF